MNESDTDDGEKWTCPYCGSKEHDSITFNEEVEIDVTCQSVYVTPTDNGHGFAFSHDEFEEIIEHYYSTEGGSGK